jgi:hypothetical protein
MVYVLKSEDTGYQKVSIYKITADGSVVTEIKKDIAIYGDQAKKLYVDSKGTVWFGHANKIDATGNYVYDSSRSANAAVDGPSYTGDQIYVTNYSNSNVIYKQFNLVSGANTTTDFNLQSLFKQDDSQFDTNSFNLSTYAVDGNDNVYVLYPLSYQSGQLTQTYLIRKTKNGSGTSTLLTKFNTKFSSSPNYIEPQGIVPRKPVMTADAIGNVYLKYNSKDIVKISQ